MAESKIKDENYFQVSGFMLNRLKLKGIMLEVYAIIYGFSQDGESEFPGSLQYLCDFTGPSRPTVIKALKDLVEKGYLIKHENEINGVKFNRYKANLQVVKNLYGGSQNNTGEVVKNFNGGSQEPLPNNILNNNSFNNINIIIDYLNEKAHKDFKSKSKATQQHINARLKEGFTVDDFKTVIDKKCAEWLGTEFEQYLRPVTLFGTKFEGYLNARSTKPTKQKYDLKGGVNL